MMNVDVIAKVGTVNTPYVVAGAYEEQHQLMNQTPFYKLRLDCLVMPEEELIIKEFYGTLEQIGDLLSEIEKDEWWAEYYASTLDAWDKYRAGDHDAEHFVGKGVERMLTPVTEICRSGYLLDKVTWGYRDKFGCIMLADAELLDVKEYLLQDGFQFIRVAQYAFEGLYRVHSDKGWVIFDGVSRGIPCIIDSHGEGAAKNRVMVVEEHYDDIEAAKRDMQTDGLFNYQEISRELFSGC